MSGSAALRCLPPVFSRRRRRLGHESLRKREDSGVAGSTIATLCCDVSPLSCSSSPPLGVVEVSLSCAEAPKSFSPEGKLLLHAASTPAANTEEEYFSSSNHPGVPSEIQDSHNYAGSPVPFRSVRCSSATNPSHSINSSLPESVRQKALSPLPTTISGPIPMHWTLESAVSSIKPAVAPCNDEPFTQNCNSEPSKNIFVPPPDSVFSPEEPLVTPSSHGDSAKEQCCSSSSTPFSLLMRFFSSPHRRRRTVPPSGSTGRKTREEEESTISSPLLAEEIDQELRKMGAPVLGDEECILRSDLTCFIDCRTLQLMDDGDEHAAQL